MEEREEEQEETRGRRKKYSAVISQSFPRLHSSFAVPLFLSSPLSPIHEIPLPSHIDSGSTRTVLCNGIHGVEVILAVAAPGRLVGRPGGVTATRRQAAQDTMNLLYVYSLATYHMRRSSNTLYACLDFL